MQQNIYTRTLFLSKMQVEYIRDLRDLTPTEITKKYGEIYGRVFYQKIVFTKEIAVEISMYRYHDNGECSVNGFLHETRYLSEDIKNIPYVEGSADILGFWEFQYEGVKYIVFVLSDEDL